MSDPMRVDPESTKRLIAHLDEYMESAQEVVKGIVYPVPDGEMFQSIMEMGIIVQYIHYLSEILKESLPYVPIDWASEGDDDE